MQIKLNVDFQVTLGTIRKWRHQGSGDGGVPKTSDKKWHRVEWGTCKEWDHHLEKYE